MIQTEPYQGAGTNDKIEDLGMGGSVVSYLISELPYTNNYCLFFDNLFTSLPLMKHLNERDYSGTGTRRVARNSQLGGLIRGSGGEAPSCRKLGVWGQSPQPLEARGPWGGVPALENSALFCKNSLILGLF